MNEVQKISLEDIEKYSPDNIDCKEFWSNCLSDKGSICGVGIEDQDPVKINYYNSLLMRQAGFYNVFPPKFETYPPVKIVEIGSGFECIRTLLSGPYLYYPCDIVKRTESTIEISDCKLPFEDEFADFVVCSNVFQHLSEKQRMNYVWETYRILKPKGIFFLSTSTSKFGFSMKTQFFCEETGKYYCKVLDQYTSIVDQDEILGWLSNVKFSFWNMSQRSDGMTGLFLIKE